MNIDAKILIKILVNQIPQCIKRIIQQDQMEFNLPMQVWLNISKSNNIIQQARKKII